MMQLYEEWLHQQHEYNMNRLMLQQLQDRQVREKQQLFVEVMLLQLFFLDKDQQLHQHLAKLKLELKEGQGS